MKCGLVTNLLQPIQANETHAYNSPTTFYDWRCLAMQIYELIAKCILVCSCLCREEQIHWNIYYIIYVYHTTVMYAEMFLNTNTHTRTAWNSIGVRVLRLLRLIYELSHRPGVANMPYDIISAMPASALNFAFCHILWLCE